MPISPVTNRFFAALASLLLLAAPLSAQHIEHPDFPYPYIAVRGDQALAAWQRLTDMPDQTAIIVGGDDDLVQLFDQFHPLYGAGDTPYAIKQYAWGMSHPESLQAMRDAEWAEMLARDAARGEDALFANSETEDALPIGVWPAVPDVYSGLASLTDYINGGRLARVHIVLLPTDDATLAPAYLRFGGWNANPPAAFHTAALIDWQARYGAVPVVILSDTMELRVTQRPATRADGMTLAQEQFLLTEDVVYQGMGSLSNLAASLKTSDWWYLWWD